MLFSGEGRQGGLQTYGKSDGTEVEDYVWMAG